MNADERRYKTERKPRQGRIRRTEGVVSRTAGVLRGDEPPLTAEELREAAERAIAAETVERSEG